MAITNYRTVGDVRLYRISGREVGEELHVNALTRVSADVIELEIPLTDKGHIRELESPLLLIVADKQFAVSFESCSRFPATFLAEEGQVYESFVLSGVRVT